MVRWLKERSFVCEWSAPANIQTHGLSVCVFAFRHLSMKTLTQAGHRDWASPGPGIPLVFSIFTCHHSPYQAVHFCDLAWQENQSLCRWQAARDIHFSQLGENRECYLYPWFKNSTRVETHGGHPISWSTCHFWKPAVLSSVQQKTHLSPDLLEEL